MKFVLPSRSDESGLIPRGKDALATRYTHLWAMVQQIRRYNLTSYSDEELKRDLKPTEKDQQSTLRVFAIVQESVRRRLGLWQLFDGVPENKELQQYHLLASQIIEARRSCKNTESSQASLPIRYGQFGEAVTPILDNMVLDQVGREIVTGIAYVLARRQTDMDSEILLPSQFYRALTLKDQGERLSFLVSDEQLMAGLLLSGSVVVEMVAGEGKTVAAAFCAISQVVQNRAVHIITANDYLAERDRDWLAPVYEFLGLSVGAVLNYLETDERKNEYEQQIVYGTLREFGFDFLRDNLRLPPDQPRQGKLEVAIVDEADHALIDQATTPLIISGRPTGYRRAFERSCHVVEQLITLQAELVAAIESKVRNVEYNKKPERILLAKLLESGIDNNFLSDRVTQDPHLHGQLLEIIDSDWYAQDTNDVESLFYLVDSRHESVTLTEKGQHFLETKLGPIFDTPLIEHRISLVESNYRASLQDRRRLSDRLRRQLLRQNSRMCQIHQILRAYATLKRNSHYVVIDGTVTLIDALTGRILPDNRYRWGLHAALQFKEDVEIQEECETLGQVSVRGYMSHYPRISGMTGTATEVAEEFKAHYGLRVVCLNPTRLPLAADLGTRIYLNRHDKFAAVADEVKFFNMVGRPILVGTQTVEQSENLSQLFLDHDISHQVLNAVTNSEEAEIIKAAGSLGSVTIATNMAGRGTDITIKPDADLCITKAYANLMRELLDNEVGSIKLYCNTQEEKAVIHRKVLTLKNVTISEDTGTDSSKNALIVSRTDQRFRDKKVDLYFGLGLYVIGTEKNQSPRVDRQLKGRSGRQGAFGGSIYILSMDDFFFQYKAHKSLKLDNTHVDSKGRHFYQGLKTERYLKTLQARLESTNEVNRNLIAQFGSVLDAHTKTYYQDRSQIITSDSFHKVCVGFTKDWTFRFLKRHFPDQLSRGYNQTFKVMAEELQLDLGIDCIELQGDTVEDLATKIFQLIKMKLEKAQSHLGYLKYTKLEKLLFLKTADQAWRNHLIEQEESVLNFTLDYNSHNSVIADLRTRGFANYEFFKSETVDIFMPRLLTFPIESPHQQIHKEIVINDQVRPILV